MPEELWQKASDLRIMSEYLVQLSQIDAKISTESTKVVSQVTASWDALGQKLAKLADLKNTATKLSRIGTEGVTLKKNYDKTFTDINELKAEFDTLMGEDDICPLCERLL